MTTISIADNDARVQYTQAVTANSTQLTIDFPFFDLDDIKVIRTTSAGVDTSLSRGTGTGTFAVSGTSVNDGYSGGYITVGDTNDNTYTYTISRDIPISRTTDFATSGPFNISSLNTELDKIYAVMQQIENANDRALTLPDSDTSSSITLPTLASRKGKYLAFNSTSGAAEIGGDVADTETVANQSANISTVAGANSNISALNASGVISNIATVAGISANVTTVATANSNISSIITNLSAVQGASANATLAQNYATETDSLVTGTSDDSSKSWATGGSGSYSMRSSGKGSSKEWATYVSGTADGTEYSAKEYAIGDQRRGSSGGGSAKDWATYTSGTVDNALYSAKYYAEQAQTASASASGSLTTFQAVWQGSGSSDPTGGTVSDGDLFYNTTSNQLKVYNSGWQAVAVDSSSLATPGQALAFAIAL
ncbi:MAG: hypothetical protein CBC24_09230 [Candidatus Pelagibacter sp. TMED64]|nr:MAG: hypothetical protein CBC24_09230 [Candidatus Pelagibacter sp. TMED64]|tara:strand:- start:1559 stop:2839 length:1281 start_codon:yes stop_codon:yes gene_type:complete